MKCSANESKFIVLQVCIIFLAVVGEGTSSCSKHVKGMLVDFDYLVSQLYVQHCTFVEIGEGMCSMFVELPLEGAQRELFFGNCACAEVRSWRLCGRRLARQRPDDCVLGAGESGARVHRRLCDVTGISQWSPQCDCSTTLAGAHQDPVCGFRTCYASPLPSSICSPRTVCGTARCEISVYGSMYAVKCDGKCKEHQPFCERVGPATSVRPSVLSEWSEWRPIGCQETSNIQQYEAECLDPSNEPAFDCLGPGLLCCANEEVDCICEVKQNERRLRAYRYMITLRRSHPGDHSAVKVRSAGIKDHGQVKIWNRFVDKASKEDDSDSLFFNHSPNRKSEQNLNPQVINTTLPLLTKGKTAEDVLHQYISMFNGNGTRVQILNRTLVPAEGKIEYSDLPLSLSYRGLSPTFLPFVLNVLRTDGNMSGIMVSDLTSELSSNLSTQHLSSAENISDSQHTINNPIKNDKNSYHFTRSPNVQSADSTNVRENITQVQTNTGVNPSGIDGINRNQIYTAFQSDKNKTQIRTNKVKQANKNINSNKENNEYYNRKNNKKPISFKMDKREKDEHYQSTALDKNKINILKSNLYNLHPINTPQLQPVNNIENSDKNAVNEKTANINVKSEVMPFNNNSNSDFKFTFQEELLNNTHRDNNAVNEKSANVNVNSKVTPFNNSNSDFKLTFQEKLLNNTDRDKNAINEKSEIINVKSKVVPFNNSNSDFKLAFQEKLLNNTDKDKNANNEKSEIINVKSKVVPFNNSTSDFKFAFQEKLFNNTNTDINAVNEKSANINFKSKEVPFNDSTSNFKLTFQQKLLNNIDKDNNAVNEKSANINVKSKVIPFNNSNSDFKLAFHEDRLSHTFENKLKDEENITRNQVVTADRMNKLLFTTGHKKEQSPDIPYGTTSAAHFFGVPSQFLNSSNNTAKIKTKIGSNENITGDLDIGEKYNNAESINEKQRKDLNTSSNSGTDVLIKLNGNLNSNYKKEEDRTTQAAIFISDIANLLPNSTFTPESPTSTDTNVLNNIIKLTTSNTISNTDSQVGLQENMMKAKEILLNHKYPINLNRAITTEVGTKQVDNSFYDEPEPVLKDFDKEIADYKILDGLKHVIGLKHSSDKFKWRENHEEKTGLPKQIKSKLKKH